MIDPVILLKAFALAVGATLLVVGAVVALAKHLERNRDDCPKLWLGYSRCNRWAGQECDHSDEEWMRVTQGARRA